MYAAYILYAPYKQFNVLMPSKRYDEPQRATFWEAIKQIRKYKGLTQNVVAERLSETADAPWISRVESGKKDISLRTAVLLAEALGENLRIGDFIIISDED